MSVTAIILAAGRGTRMGDGLPKPLRKVCGQPMLWHALSACYGAEADRVLVVVGHGSASVRFVFAGDDRITWVEQAEQLGTGHAVMVCEDALRGVEGDVLVLAGDMPLVRAATLRRLLDVHRAAGAAVSLATAEMDDPTGYGRIVRGADGTLSGIVEHRDCSPGELAIREVNISYYCFRAGNLVDAVRRVRPQGAKGERCITEAVGILVADGGPSATLPGIPPEDALGVNSPEDLEIAEAAMLARGA